jgi:pyruvate formate lyase activating enzyme
VAEVIDQLERLHVVLDTSGFGSETSFRMVGERVDLVYFDLKLMDPGLHRRYTGQDNRLVLRNLDQLARMETSCVIRVPLVPGVTDREENLAAIARAAAGLPHLVRVDLLPYNRAAGGKFSACGLEFRPHWDESQPVRADTSVFQAAGVPVSVR